jgi:hypothetical protein
MRHLLPSCSLLVLVSLTALGCSSAGTQVRPRAPWEPELAEFFDDAADFIEDPGDLEGAWATDYSTGLQGRIDEADLIARVLITTINEDINVEGQRRKHLLAQITSTFAGEAPTDERLQLMVDDGAEGFDTIDRGERRLFNNRFVAFVRWYESEDGVVRAHWHLSPGSRPVVDLVRRSVDQRRQQTGNGEGGSSEEGEGGADVEVTPPSQEAPAAETE